MTCVDPTTLVLASASPRRSDLLRRAGVRFEVCPADIPELEQPGETPVAFAQRLAHSKALSVAERIGASPPRLVLGADTIVVLNGAVLGKPRDSDHALEDRKNKLRFWQCPIRQILLSSTEVWRRAPALGKLKALPMIVIDDSSSASMRSP